MPTNPAGEAIARDLANDVPATIEAEAIAAAHCDPCEHGDACEAHPPIPPGDLRMLFVKFRELAKSWERHARVAWADLEKLKDATGKLRTDTVNAQRAAEYARHELREHRSEQSIAARAYDALTLEVERCTGAEPIEAAAAVRRLHKERDVAVRECGAAREQMMAMGVRAKETARAEVAAARAEEAEERADLRAQISSLAERCHNNDLVIANLHQALENERLAHAATRTKRRRRARARAGARKRT